MPTRGLIGYKVGTKDGDKIKFAYCYFDSYLEYVGVLLRDFYNMAEKVLSLIDERSICHLKKTIEDTEFYSYSKDDSTFYISYSDDWHTLSGGDSDFEFVYVFENGEWFYFTKESHMLKPLAIENIKSIVEEEE